MIKVFKGGYEVAQEYYFNYESYGSDIYDSETRIITGLLSLKNLTEFQQLAIVNKLDGSDLVIIEPSQSGYMVNLLNVREIEFTKNMSNTESIYRITGAKRMKPRKASNYRIFKMTDRHGMTGFTVGNLVSVTVDHIARAGNFRMIQGTDIRYMWVGNEPFPDLQYEIGECRIKEGDDFYITQTGGASHKMQMPSLSGVPFPNSKIVFNSLEPLRTLFSGQRLEVDYILPNLISGTKDFSGSWVNLEKYYNNGEYRGMTVKSTLGTTNSGVYQRITVPSDGEYTFSVFAKTSGVVGEVDFQVTGTGGSTTKVNFDNKTFKRISSTRTLKSGDVIQCYVRLSNNNDLKKDAFQFAGYKLEKNSEATDWVE